MKNLFQNTRNQNDQAGIASILVTMIMMVVLSLIVLGFATISRREQTNSLNTQLSSQAFYAAETGVNDAQQAITAQFTANGSIPAKSTCGADTADYPSLLPAYSTLNVADNVSYSCLLINPTPPALIYSDINSASTVVPVNNSSGTALNNLTLTWHASDQATSMTDPANVCLTTASQALPSQANWIARGCDYGVLRVELVPTDPGSISSESTLLDKEMTFFLSPVFDGSGSGASVIYNPCGPTDSPGADCGAIISDHCVDGGAASTANCTATITNLNSANYTLRIQSLYQDSYVSLTPDSDAALTGAQVLIDSTGQANGVLRRIQVRFSLTSAASAYTPDEAVEAGGNICKRFVTSNTAQSFDDYTGGICAVANYVTPPPPGNAGIGTCAEDPTNPACAPMVGGTQERTYYNAYFFNRSNNPGLTVIGCTWAWNDGTTTSGGTIFTNGQSVNTGQSLDSASCEPGEPINHCYPYVTKDYNITLTVYLSNGSQGATQYNQYEPYTEENYQGNQCSVPAG